MTPSPSELSRPVEFYRWDDVALEPVSDMLSRKLITGERIMLAHVHLKKGCVVPAHKHQNEQMSYILEGALLFEIDGKELTVKKGEVLYIPSNIEHKATALEDTLSVDVFSPPREDWLNKTDEYLRKK